jgi:acyl-CoA thioesterase
MTILFDRDTAVERQRGSASEAVFAANVSGEWRAGRGPHGGYLAAMLLRALIETVADAARAPRSLTIHYPRAPQPGPVSIHTTLERAGRSLSTLSARMEQDGEVVALALAAFSVPWRAPEISDVEMPGVAGPDARREPGTLRHVGAPPFTRHLVFQPRIGTPPFTGSEQPMEIGGWLGLATPRPIDALSLAFFSDALFPPPFIRLSEPAVSPTIDLTIHFRTGAPRSESPDPGELCLVRFRSSAVHEGFFEEDGVIWGADGTVLVHSRQLALLMPRRQPR